MSLTACSGQVDLGDIDGGSLRNPPANDGVALDAGGPIADAGADGYVCVPTSGGGQYCYLPDAGAVSYDDAGHPIGDAGIPFGDSGVPFDDSGFPVDDGGPPVFDAGSGEICIDCGSYTYCAIRTDDASALTCPVQQDAGPPPKFDAGPPVLDASPGDGSLPDGGGVQCIDSYLSCTCSLVDGLAYSVVCEQDGTCNCYLGNTLASSVVTSVTCTDPPALYALCGFPYP